MKQIPLSQGLFAIVDDEDFGNVGHIKWHAHRACNTFYAQTHICVGGKQTTIRMHRMIMGDIPKGLVVDHISRDGLDNRRCNLRVVTQAENLKNCGSRRLYRSSRSGIRGVSQHPKTKKWHAKISCQGEFFIGSFSTKEDAAAAYAKKHQELFGAA